MAELDPMFQGNDNYGNPKSDYLSKLAGMNDEALFSECYGMIYQAALCNNNPRADWHWMTDACYVESQRRDDKEIYKRAFDKCYAEHAS